MLALSSDFLVPSFFPMEDSNPPDSSSSASAPPPQNPNYDSNPTVESLPPPPPLPETSIKKRKKKKEKERAMKDVVSSAPSSPSAASLSSASSFSSSYSSTSLFTTRFSIKRRHPKVVFAPARRVLGGTRGGGGGGGAENSVVEAIALPLGMSIAAVIAQVLEKKDAAAERISPDHLSRICSSAVRESLANVFGDKFEFFVRNFEKSFGSTLRTLRLIRESSTDDKGYQLNHLNVECSASDATCNKRIGRTSFLSTVKDCPLEADLPSSSIQDRINTHQEVEGSSSTVCINQELALHGRMNQLACVPSSLGLAINQLKNNEKLAIEQSRSNDLKTVEIGLKAKELAMKEAELALKYESNHLERSKLATGKLKRSFRTEKFKSQLEETRHADLLIKCIDCLAAGMVIMVASLLYGAYVYSYNRITEAAASCNPPPEEPKSWWMPRSISSINYGMHTLKCQVLVLSRMLFGGIVILAVAIWCFQHASNSPRKMPITLILLLLGAVCGLAGKFCVDTLGGSGNLWLLYWEALCLLHFLSNVCTSTLFCVLYGPVDVSQGPKPYGMHLYWLRQFLFFFVLLLFLPLSCGLLPFASHSEWKDHFYLLAMDFVSAGGD